MLIIIIIIRQKKNSITISKLLLKHVLGFRNCKKLSRAHLTSRQVAWDGMYNHHYHIITSVIIIPCVGTCAQSSGTGRALRTDSSDNGSASVYQSARNLPVGHRPELAWTFQNLRPWSSPISGAGACAPPPCWCPCTRTRTSDNGNATLCFDQCL